MQTCLLPFRGGRVGLLFSVCKGKQLYSESNRFSGYWSNKFCKCLCNYLFYREIYRSLPRPLRKEGRSPTRPPRRGRRRQVCKYFAEKYLRKESRVLILSCAHRNSPPFGGVGGGCRGWVGLFLFPITQSQSQNHKKDFQCVKRGSYII